MIKLICGLGNHGKEYSKTRHNAAWMILDALPFSLDYQKKFKGRYAQHFMSPQRKLLFLRPETFMNKSGESLRACMDYFSIGVTEVLVVHDDLELPYGKKQIKQGGGLAGHNGLKSLAQHLGSREFSRLRFGIGRPSHGKVSDFVLNRFTKDEEIDLQLHIEDSVKLLLDSIE